MPSYIADTFNMEVVATLADERDTANRREWRSGYLPAHPTGSEIIAAMSACPLLNAPAGRAVLTLRVVHAGETLARVVIAPGVDVRLLWSLADVLWHVAAELIRAAYDDCLDAAEERHQLFLRYGNAPAPEVSTADNPF